MKQLRSLLLVCLISVFSLNAYSFVAPSDFFNWDVLNEKTIQLQEEFDFKINPNPANDYLKISLTQLNADGVTVEVFDVLGKRILKQNLSKIKSSIDVSNWKSGLYLVKVSSKEFSQTKRFLKR